MALPGSGSATLFCRRKLRYYVVKRTRLGWQIVAKFALAEDHERTAAYGLVSATFAASLVTSPALGAWLEANFGEELGSITIIAYKLYFFFGGGANKAI